MTATETTTVRRRPNRRSMIAVIALGLLLTGGLGGLYVLDAQGPRIYNYLQYQVVEAEGPTTEGPSQVWHVSPDSSSLAFSPGQNVDILAAGLQDGSIELRRAGTGQAVSTVKAHSGAVTTLTFSHQGSLLASSADDGTARLWRLSTTTAQGGTLQSASLQPVGDGLQAGVTRQGAFAFSPDDTMLAAAGTEGEVKLYDIATGRGLGIVTPGEGSSTDEVAALSFSRGGGVLTLVRHTGEVERYHLSVSVSAGRRRVSAQLADAIYGLPGRDTGHTAGMVLSQDGSLAASAYTTDPGARLWSALSGSDLAQLEGAGYPLSALALSADGRWLAGGEAPLDLTANGITSLPTPIIPPSSYVHVWSTVHGRRTMLLSGHTGGVTALAFSPDGEWLASAGNDGTVKLWRNQQDR